MESIVALDLETTGLDPERDAIIEVGAVRFRGSRVEAEWSSLINPGRHVPDFVTGLTGIDDAMLRQAPKFSEVADDILAFIGSDPILGHNVRFDLGFLGARLDVRAHEVIDTYELASVLLPSADRYNLGAMGKELGIMLPATHRALDDARVTQRAYVRLLELMAQLPSQALREIVQMGEQLTWDGNHAFRAESLARGLSSKKQAGSRKAASAAPRAERAAELEIPETPQPLDVQEVAAILEQGGTFSKQLKAFEYRPEQVEMLRAVGSALSQGKHLMVEAGTGIGKSFAYLIPAALFAWKNNTRVVISTNTINLQDQLIRKDIPDLARGLDLDLRAAVLKGRGNYLCPRRFAGLIRIGPRTADEMRVLAKILVWRLSDTTGDRGNLHLNGAAEREVWTRLSADDEACTAENCIRRTGGTCPFHLARGAAQSAHLLIVNHALLLSDVAAEGKVLPEYANLIVDEAHHLEAATTSALTFRLTQFDLDRMLREIGGSASGMLGTVLGICRKSLGASDFAGLQQMATKATDAAFRLGELSREFFKQIANFANSLRQQTDAGNYAWQARLLPSSRTLPAWDGVEIAWDACHAASQTVLKALADIHQSASLASPEGPDTLLDALGDLATITRRLSEVEASVTALVEPATVEQVHWIEIHPNGQTVALNSAPLRVGPLIEQVLWHEKSSIILTSATMTAHGEFSYLRNTLGADEADELQLGSPFDYENSTLLYVANDMPEPNTPQYQGALSRALIKAATASGGRMLALFTSYAALRKASQAITAPLGHEDISVFEQGDGVSPSMLLDSFRATDRAVLLGTRSFWEGVDVPGSALSMVCITKLPFDVPTDPLVAARSELYEDPFYEYYLPEAILKFRQGFGRLIRTAADRGVVLVLDRRVLSKQYGRWFLESLPRCTSRLGPVAGIAAEAGRWLGA